VLKTCKKRAKNAQIPRENAYKFFARFACKNSIAEVAEDAVVPARHQQKNDKVCANSACNSQ